MLFAASMRRLPIACALAAAATFAGCAGDPPDGTDVDAATSDGGGIDGAPVAGLQVTGKSKDYFTAVTLSSVAITTTGMQPEVNGSSTATGDFVLDDVPPGSVFYVSAQRELYRLTRNLAVRVTEASVIADQLVVSAADTRRQYVSVGRTPTLGTAVVFAELRRNNGMPLEGVPLADIVLVDGLAAPVGLGPFFFGANGDIVSNLTLATSTAFNGRARVAFLDVPPGPVTLKVSTVNGMGLPVTEDVLVEVTADGASIAATGAMGMGPGMGARTFTADIYPRLQTAANGGLACANCHTLGGPAAVLPYDLPVQMVYDAIKLRPNVINLLAPAESLFLTKPLYEDPPNHPNATFLDVTDPDYLIFLQWITQGAVL